MAPRRRWKGAVHSIIPEMEKGDVIGHETMGEVVEVGPANHKLSFLYSLMEAPRRHDALVLYPVPALVGPPPPPAAHAKRPTPYELAGPDFGFASRDGFSRPEAGLSRLRCLASPQSLPAAEHAR